jgi:hypothetical protein
MRYFCGLDLGQLADYSALSVIERIEDQEFYRYECRHIERFPLGLPYPRIVARVGDLRARTPLARNCQLVIDNSGVGVAVADMFSEAGIPYIGVTITGGVGWHRESWRRWYVSKHLLVSTIQKFLSSEALGISRQLPEAALLRSELQNFRVKVSKTAHEIYESREGEHDDITCSLAVALFVAEHPGHRFVPIGD